MLGLQLLADPWMPADMRRGLAGSNWATSERAPIDFAMASPTAGSSAAHHAAAVQRRYAAARHGCRRTVVQTWDRARARPGVGRWSDRDRPRTWLRAQPAPGKTPRSRAARRSSEPGGRGVVVMGAGSMAAVDVAENRSLACRPGPLPSPRALHCRTGTASTSTARHCHCRFTGLPAPSVCPWCLSRACCAPPLPALQQCRRFPGFIVASSCQPFSPPDV